MNKQNKLQTVEKIAKTWNSLSDAENFNLNRQFLKKHVCKLDEVSLKNKHWVFSHVPKTAGTSCENYVAQLFLIQDTLHINAPDLNEFPHVVSLKNQFPHYIAGHHPLHGMLYQLLPDQELVHLSLLREPVARVLSYYNYLMSRQSHSLHHSVKDLTFDTFIKQPMVEIHNGQSRRLAGLLHSNENISDSKLFDRAKYVVDNCFTLVGMTEQLEDFICIIERITGVKIYRLARKNQSQISLSRDDINPTQLEIINNNNASDIMLYQYVFDKFNQLLNI